MRYLLTCMLYFALACLLSTSLKAQDCDNPSVNLPDANHPVDGDVDNSYCVTFVFDPAVTGVPSGLSMELVHTFEGDLSVFVNACGNTLNVMQRPGVLGSCGGSCDCGSGADIGNPPNGQVEVIFSDSGVVDPEDGISNGGFFAITDDDDCGIGTPGINSFADLFAACPPGLVTTEICITDHAFQDVGVASNITYVFPNPIVCGCTNPLSPNYDPDANVDDGSCIEPCEGFEVLVSPDNEASCAGGSIALEVVVENGNNPTIVWTATGNGMIYLDDPSSTNPNVTIPPGTSAGTIVYTVNVSDESGCMGEGTAEITINEAPEVIASDIIDSCEGFENGEVQLEGVGGEPPYIFTVVHESAGTLEAAGTSVTMSNLFSGNYNVFIEDDNGCVGTTSFSIGENPAPQPEIEGEATFCFNSSSVLSLTETYQFYEWSTGEFSPTIEVFDTEFISVFVTDELGCEGEAEIEITVLDPDFLDIEGEDSFCPGGSTTLSIAGSFLSYDWSTSDNGSLIEVTEPGTYSVTVVDLNNCEAEDAIEVFEFEDPNPVIEGPTTICENASIELSLADDYLDQDWSTGDIDNTITVTEPGTYSVTVISDDLCLGTTTHTVNSAPINDVTIFGNLTYCTAVGGTNLSVSDEFLEYEWSNGEEGPTIFTDGAGLFSVTVVDEHDCPYIDEVNVFEEDELSPTITGDLFFCEGSSTTLGIAGTYDTYQWSNNTNASTVTLTTPGTYSVTVEDAAGCIGSSSIEIAAVPLPTPIITGNLSFCENTSTVLSTGAYETYQWAGVDSDTSFINVTTPGNYSVTVTDSNNCEGITMAEVEALPLPAPQILGTPGFCPNEETILNGEEGFISYNWNNGTTLISNTIDTIGLVELMVTDTNNCVGQTSLMVEEFLVENPEIIGDSLFCPGTSTLLEASAGFVTTTWSTGSQEGTLEVTEPSIISLSVIDQNNCETAASIQVSEYIVTTPEIIAPAGFCAGESALLNTPDIYQSYLWSTGDNTTLSSISAGGQVDLSVVDQNDCVTNSSIFVEEYALPTPQIEGALVFCTDNNTVLNADAVYETYNWSSGDTINEISVSTPGTIGLTVTDQNGCENEVSEDVTEVPELFPEILGPLQYCEGDATVLNIDAFFTNYEWSTGENGNEITVSSPGLYSIIVEDAAGCIGTAEVEVVANPLPEPEITGEFSFCAGLNTNLTLTENYETYTWSDTSFLNQLTITQPGNYFVTVTDENNCANQTSVFVQENALPTPQIEGDLIFCEGASTMLGTTISYETYDWASGISSPEIVITNPGEVILIVTDENGCEGTTSEQLIEIPTPTPVIEGLLDFCEGLSTNLTATTGFTAYQWSTGGEESFITTNTSGDYSVIVTDEFGCEGTTAVNVVVHPLPQPEIIGELSFCAGESTNLSLTEGYETYDWNNDSASSQIEINTEGNYAVTVTDSNDCQNDVAVFVEELALPEFAIEGILHFCIGSATELNISPAFDNYEWSFGTNNNEQTIAIDQEGIVNATVTDTEGCSNSEAVTVAEIPLPIADPGADYIINCYDETIILGGTNTSVGEDYTYLWTGPGITTASATVENPEVNIEGTYFLTVFDNLFNCESEPVQTEVADQTNEPFVDLAVDEILDCITTAVTIDGSSSDQGNEIVYQWYTEAGNVIENENTFVLTTENPGVFSLEITDIITGCSNIQSAEVEQYVDYPFAEAGNPQELNCADITALLDGTASENSNEISYNWYTATGNITQGTQSATPTVNEPGWYYIEVINNTNSCLSLDSVMITQDILAPLADAGEEMMIDCNTSSVSLNGGGSSQGANFIHQWYFEGQAINNATTTSLNAEAIGNYTIEVLNTDNGCSSTDMTLISQGPLAPVSLEAVIDEPTCFGDTDGSIIIQTVEGGNGPYVYSINGSPFTQQSFFINLGSGDYDVLVEDAYGCNYNTTLNIEQSNDLFVELGPDYIVDWGEEIDIISQINIDSSDLAGIAWESGTTLPCQDCLFQNDILMESSNTFLISIQDENGCIAKDRITIFVKKERLVYIPTAFSPTNDGINDIFYIFSGSGVPVKNIRSFLVFNRWGEPVFEVYDSLPNNPAWGWDGKYRGEVLNPAVFAYFAEIEFEDGEVILFEGDVSLIK